MSRAHCGNAMSNPTPRLQMQRAFNDNRGTSRRVVIFERASYSTDVVSSHIADTILDSYLILGDM